MGAKLLEVLAELRNAPREVLIQPELKQHRQQLDERLREEHDLESGAVLQAVVKQGTGGSTPVEGDLVFVHVSISEEADEDDLLWSTKAEEGGSGGPLALLIEKGARAPRAWEIALKAMTKGQVNRLRIKPSYGFRHPLCKMPPPPGVPAGQPLACTLELVELVSGQQARACGADQRLIKQVLAEGNSWENARPPFEVTLHATVRTLSYDGIHQSGQVLFSTDQSAQSSRDPLHVALGSGQLPAGVEEALGLMCKGERSLFIIPASAMQPQTDTGDCTSQQQAGGMTCLLPPPPAKAVQLEVELELLSVVQVRDMTGTGEVTKRRLKEGDGEFPIDCPLNDTTIRVHYRVRQLALRQQQQQSQSSSAGAQGDGGGWVYDTRDAKAAGGGAAGESPDHPQGAGVPPLEIDTGCGEAPEAVEMCAKLMVPGELALVRVTNPRFAYLERTDIPPGISPGDPVEFEILLVSFDKEGHWQALEMEERFGLAERIKTKANSLVKAGKHAFARARYDRLLRMLESTRDYETQEEVDRMDKYKVAVLSNLALCAISLEEYSEAVAYCDKALQYDDKNAKVVFRRGRAMSLKGDYEEAEVDLKHAAELDPSVGPEVTRELAANKQRAKAAEHKQRQQLKSFLKRGQ